jgi:hypothetical protein
MEDTNMSRYIFCDTESKWRIVVGWDNPLETFLAQVWHVEHVNKQCEPLSGDVEPVLWLGCWRNEVPSVELLNGYVELYADIPQDFLEKMREDQASRTLPTSLQMRLGK